MKLDFTKMTWEEMAEVVRDLWIEMKRRNPIGINLYQPALLEAYARVREIAVAEKINPTAEAGPGIDKPKERNMIGCAKCGCLEEGHHGKNVGGEGIGGNCPCDGVYEKSVYDKPRKP